MIAAPAGPKMCVAATYPTSILPAISPIGAARRNDQFSATYRTVTSSVPIPRMRGRVRWGLSSSLLR